MFKIKFFIIFSFLICNILTAKSVECDQCLFEQQAEIIAKQEAYLKARPFKEKIKILKILFKNFKHYSKEEIATKLSSLSNQEKEYYLTKLFEKKKFHFNTINTFLTYFSHDEKTQLTTTHTDLYFVLIINGYAEHFKELKMQFLS